MKDKLTHSLKKQLRQHARSMRHKLSDKQLLQADSQLALQYKQNFTDNNFRSAAIYLQNDYELGTTHLIELLFQTGCKLYLPRISTNTSDHQMQFVRYEHNNAMRNNRFGIPEPVTDEIICVNQLELIFMPLTAFDLQGNRLGMGGGFYDRTLANLRDTKPLLIGLAYDFQQIPECPTEVFDQPMQMIITPTRVIEF